jgi:hypothetical protein
MKPLVLEIKSAGPDHQVVTIQGGTDGYRRSPCPTCPWRIDAVGVFPPEAFVHSANTAYRTGRKAPSFRWGM